MQAKQKIKRAQKKRNERISKNRKEVVLKIGDLVNHKLHLRLVSGKVKRSHVNDLKLAGLEEWEIPKKKKRQINKLEELDGLNLPQKHISNPK